jgi:hypothetical protein
MRSIGFVALLGLLACEGGRSILVVDAAVDAPAADADCPSLRTGQCNPLAGTGCALGHKCTWLWLEEDEVGFLGCIPEGTAEIGEACARFETEHSCRVAITDDCAKGAFCFEGTCAAICGVDRAGPHCTGEDVCTTIENAFTFGTHFAGVCR